MTHQHAAAVRGSGASGARRRGAQLDKRPARQCVAVDMRGYNLSDKPPGREAYRIDVMTEDVAALVGALGHERCRPRLASSCTVPGKERKGCMSSGLGHQGTTALSSGLGQGQSWLLRSTTMRSGRCELPGHEIARVTVSTTSCDACRSDCFSKLLACAQWRPVCLAKCPGCARRRSERARLPCRCTLVAHDW